jgi:hypothetical protein
MAESSQPEGTPAASLATAYLRVFGASDRDRDADQKLVWRDMESFCHAYRSSVEQTRDGDMVENNTLVNEGRRTYWLRARGQIQTAVQPPAPALKVSRKRVKP